MSAENPFKPPVPTAGPRSIEGEILPPDSEDPRVLRKFGELPVPIAEQWRRMPLDIRRMIISDEQILNMPVEEMVRQFVKAHPEYQTPAEAQKEMDERWHQSVSNVTPESPRPMKDVTPPPEDQLRKIAEVKRRLLGR